jgi:hypothetical protein
LAPHISPDPIPSARKFIKKGKSFTTGEPNQNLRKRTKIKRIKCKRAKEIKFLDYL